MRSYLRLEIEPFGRHLLSHGDLDPIYIALVSARKAGDFSESQINRWLLGYWCYYHAGVASFLSEKEGEEFWHWMEVAARNEEESPVGGRWPRGHERRHFRSRLAADSVADLCVRYPNPEDMVRALSARSEGERLSLKTVSDRAQNHRGFGPWIGFKIADMLDRVTGVSVDFDNAAVFMFKDPQKAAIMLWEQREAPKYSDKKKPARETILNGVAEYLISYFSDYAAPPLADRPVNIQEIETILCKWKSHVNGHYPLWNDIREVNKGLIPWIERSVAARSFYHHMPKEQRE